MLGGHTVCLGQSGLRRFGDDAHVLFTLLDVTPLPLSKEKRRSVRVCCAVHGSFHMTYKYNTFVITLIEHGYICET